MSKDENENNDAAKAAYFKKSVRVSIGIPCYSYAHVHFVNSLMRLHEHMAGKLVYGIAFATGARITENRNAIVKMAQEAGSTHIMWLDSDMIVPPDTVFRLLSYDLPIVGAVYSRRVENKAGEVVGVPEQMRPDDLHYHDMGLREYSGVGLGCLLTKIEIFDKMDKPYFAKPIYNEICVGEDIYFCSNARDKGYRIWIDTELSKEVAHIGTKNYVIAEGAL